MKVKVKRGNVEGLFAPRKQPFLVVEREIVVFEDAMRVYRLRDYMVGMGIPYLFPVPPNGKIENNPAVAVPAEDEIIMVEFRELLILREY
jgi:hypothetical protein